jgi:hypothetical protein
MARAPDKAQIKVSIYRSPKVSYFSENVLPWFCRVTIRQSFNDSHVVGEDESLCSPMLGQGCLNQFQHQEHSCSLAFMIGKVWVVSNAMVVT